MRIGSHNIELYEGIDSTPITNDVLSNKFALIDAQVGSGLPAIREHIVKLAGYIKNKDEQSAFTELQNLDICISSTEEGINHEHMAFAARVKSIDGKKVYDYSDEALKRMCKQFGQWGLSSGLLRRTLQSIKKKMITR